MDMQNIARIFFPKALQVVVGCGAEPTINTNFMQLLELAASYKVPNISIVTNGVLLRQSQIERMHQIGVDEIILSAHGLTRSTYEEFMTNSHFEKFIKLLDSISTLNQNNNLKIRINYTANNDNLDDLKQLPVFLDRFNISTVQIRPIMDIGGKYNEPISGDNQLKYIEIVNSLKRECHERNVTLLANTSDVSYNEINKDADIIESIYTYISPQTVSELSLGTKTNSLRAYKLQTKWYSKLMQRLIKSGASNKYLERSLKYDIQ